METVNDNTNTTNQEINEMDYLVIPNPIYDVVFRYLMQDYDSAMIILSTLINEKIKKLDFQPLTFAKKATAAEYNAQIEQKVNKRFEAEKQKIIANNSLSELDKTIAINEITIKDPVTGKDVKLLHLDFAAVIEKENGEEEMVMIELQKVAMETDIFRFKQYIAENFQKKRKITKKDSDTGQVVKVELPYRLIPIFILNFTIEDEISDLVIKTRQIKTGIFTDKEIDKKNDFIDHLSYELYVVQLPYLQQVEKLDFEHIEYKQKLFALLKLFDQQAKKADNEYRLRLFRKLFPGFLDRVIQRLQTADADNPNLEKQMQAEDYYLKPLLQRDNKISWLLLNKKQIEKELKENKKALEENKKALEDKDKSLEDKDKALEDKDKALEDNKKALEDKDKVIYQLAEILKANGISNEEIYEKTGLPMDKIKNL
jgi:phosphotransferase system IIA component